MKTSLDSPLSSYSATHHDSSKKDVAHSSGMTMAEFTKEPQIHLIHASPSPSQRSSEMASKRTSIATVSTTKSHLRQSNHLLIEMLQNIQTELSAHRTIMLDIQHRVSHLEHESNASINNDAPLAALKTLEGDRIPSQRNSKLVPPEGLSWWQACQNFARNSEPPISAAEFLRTPKRFSGFDFQFCAPPSARPETPPATPPHVNDLPPLTPTSEEGEHSDLDTPLRHDILAGEEIAVSERKVMPEVNSGDDTMGQVVKVDRKKVPAPPILHPAPSGKGVIVDNSTVILATGPDLLGNPHRYYNGVKSLSTYKALLKHKTTDKEHNILIHFHRRADLRGSADA